MPNAAPFRFYISIMTRNPLPHLLLAAALTACGGDNADDTNANANIATGGMPSEVTRLEFPKVQGGASIILTHSTDDSYGTNYCVEWDTSKKTQRWTCYQMRKGYKGDAGRYKPEAGERQYPYDPDLPEQYRYSKDPFTRSGYDHGHICPSADRQYSKEANKQTFYMTNMQPMLDNFNAGLWEKMERQVRAWTDALEAGGIIYVCKGGTIDNPSQTAGTIGQGLPVPKYFYMALLLHESGGYRALAFWAEHTDDDRAHDELAPYAITIDELERRTGIDFFCNLPDATENKVESTTDIAGWGLAK